MKTQMQKWFNGLIFISLLSLVFQQTAGAISFDQIKQAQTQGQVLGTSTIALLAHNFGSSTSGVDVINVAPINSTGASLLVATFCSYNSAPAPVVSDSNGNSWHLLTGKLVNAGGGCNVYIAYAYDKSGSPLVTGSSNTMSIITGGSGGFQSVEFMAFSGTLTGSSPFDVQNGTPNNSGSSSTSLQPGSITPTADGDLIISGLSFWSTDTGHTIDSGFTITDQVAASSGNHFASAGAYFVQPTAAAINPTWSDATSQVMGGVIAAFKASTSTSSNPPVISNVVSSGITSSGATLTWNTDLSSDSQVDYGTTTSYGSLSALNSSLMTNHSVTLSSLSASTLYHYRVRSSNNGNLAVSADNTFTTSTNQSDTQAPTVPTNLSATAISSSTINLSWTASTDNVGVTGYKIYRGGVQINTTGSTSYSDSGLSASTQYAYTVSAFDAAGNTSAQSSSSSATTQAGSGGESYAVGWTDLTNTHLHSVCPPSTGTGGPGSNNPANYAFSVYCVNVVPDWSGGVGDTLRNRLIVFGGGHQGYDGNEIYSVDLSTLSSSIATGGTVHSNPAVPSMTRLNNPSNWNYTTSWDINTDGSPTSRHTYNGVVYLPSQDALFTFSGGNASGTGSNRTWLYTFADSTWHSKDPVNGFDPTTVSTSVTGAACAYDPNTQDVFCTNGNTSYLYKYDPPANTYTKLSTAAAYPIAATPAIDPVHKLMVFMGQTCCGGPAVSAIDISGSDPTYTVQNWTSQVTGCSLMEVTWPAFVWDSAIQKFVGWPNFGNTVYIFDPVTKTCTSQTFAGGPPNAPAPVYGTFGRFQYFPALDVFAVVNNADSDAYVLKITNTASPSDTQAPTVPTSLSATAISSSAINLSWTASTDNVAVIGYKIYRGGVQIGTSTLTSYLDNNLVSSTTYSYTVAAYDAAGNVSANSAPASATTLTVQSNQGASLNGLGASTLTCIDVDGDGYGTGPGCAGADADDSDATVHTGPEAIAKWGSLVAFLQHRGYTNTSRIWYVAPTGGIDSLNCLNNVSQPCATWGYVVSHMSGGDMLLARGGTWTGVLVRPPAGTVNNPTVLMAYPGELPFLDNTTVLKTRAIAIDNIANVTVDGLKVSGGLGTSGCIGGGGVGTSNITIRYTETFYCSDAGLDFFDGLSNFLIEYNVMHDFGSGPCAGSCQHALYMGARMNPDSNITIRRNILYNPNNGFPVLQWNGRVTNLQIDQNIIYNGPGTSGITIFNGMSNSFVRNNLVFNNAGGGGAGVFVSAYDNNFSCFDGAPLFTGICPWPQTNNLWENNTIIQNGTGPDGSVGNPPGLYIEDRSSGCMGGWFSGRTYTAGQLVLWPYQVSGGTVYTAKTTLTNDTASPDTDPANWSVGGNWNQGGPNGSSGTTCTMQKISDQGTGNVYRNNIIAGWGIPILMPMATLQTGTLFPGPVGGSWSVRDNSDRTLVNSTFQNNLTWQISQNGTNALSSAPHVGSSWTNHTIAQLSAGTGCDNSPCWNPASSGNVQGNPGFAAFNTTWWNTPSAYDFHLAASSPAVGAGTLTGVPTYDIVGNTFNNPPSIGAYEYNSTGTPPPAVPTINNFTASVNPIIVGNSTTLSFSATNATSLSLDNGIGSVTGLTTKVVSPSVTTTYTLTATNSNGSVTSTVTVVVNNAPDTTNPTASITTPSSGSTVSGTITVSASASDPTVSGQVTSGLNLVTLSIDGSVFATSTAGTISKSLDTTTLTNGSHTISVIAKDNAGNTSTASTITITVSNQSATKYPRLVTLTSLEGLSAIPSNTIITATVLSPSSGSVLETQSNITADKSANYTITFLNTDPQTVNFRIQVNGYLSQLLTNIDTTVNSSSALSVPQLLAGDFNNDNTINSLDYSLMNSHFLQNFSSADINKDNLVNSLDFAILKNNYGKSGQ